MTACLRATRLGPLLLVGLAACARPEVPARQLVEFSGPTMGTTWTVKVVTGPEPLSSDLSRRLDRAVRDDLARINQLMSTWDPASELSRFNAWDSLAPFPIAVETFEVFQRSQEVWAETDGAFDPTIGPLIDAWGFGVARDVPVPDEATIERLRASTGMRQIELAGDGRTVRKLRHEVRVDFSAIAPGYAADRLAGRIAELGLRDFLVDVGGELVASGQNADAQPWQVGIELPQARGRRAARSVPLVDAAIATSGDYRNLREVNGQRLTHILDPRTGRPIRHALASVTVVDRQAVRADALATALMVMGPDQAQAFAAARQIPALFLIRRPDGSFEERLSPAFAPLAVPPAADLR
jgi:thiamine biosynthesis lipoprotein